jgi:serine/threonine protein kinase
VIASPQDFIVMLELMVECRFEIPDNLDLSEDCKDLLRRMLLPEPHKRITTEEILEHPWFNTNLPPEAATMNDRCLMLAPMPGVPDAETIRQIVHAACSHTLYSGSSGHMSGSNKGSRESSDTRTGNSASGGAHGVQQMHAGMQPQYGYMQQQIMQPQQLTPQQLQVQQQQQAHQLQAQQQRHMQMMWQQQQAQQQAVAAGVYVQQHELQQPAQQQGPQPPFYHI